MTYTEAVKSGMNVKCRNFVLSDGEARCEAETDMCFCSRNCAFATNNCCVTKLDKNGNAACYSKSWKYKTLK